MRFRAAIECEVSRLDPGGPAPGTYGPPSKPGQTFHEPQMKHQKAELPAFCLNPVALRVQSAAEVGEGAR